MANIMEHWNHALRGSRIGLFELDLKTGKSVVSDTWRSLMDIKDDVDFQEVFLSRVHPDDIDNLRSTDEACFAGETDRSIAEYRVRFGDTWRWMKSDAAIVERAADGSALRFVGTQIDITQRKEAELALLASREQFRLILEHAPVVMAIFDDDGDLINSNAAFNEMFGFSEADRKGLSFRNLVSAEELENIYEPVAELRKRHEQSYYGEHRFRTASGREFWGIASISWTGAGQEEDENRVYIMQIQDISDQKALARMKDEFVATVSHELRTPLTSINGAIKLLGRVKMPEDADRLLRIAESNGKRLARLVDDILDITRLATEDLKRNRKTVSINEVARATVAMAQTYDPEKRVSIRLMPSKTEPHCRVNRMRLEQVLFNLLSNAVKFSPPGEIVDVVVEADGDSVQVSVADRGVGIDPALHEKIFEPFFRVDMSDARSTGGTGLGLKIARDIVQQMGGEIGLEGECGVGTTFWVRFRQCAAPEQHQAKAS